MRLIGGFEVEFWRKIEYNLAMKILVTGASGQTGACMINFLLKETDYDVLGSIRRTSKLIDQNFEHHYQNDRFKIINLDLDDVHSITSVVKDEKPDIIFNFGGRAFVPDSWNSPAATIVTNTISIIHFLEAIKNFNPECRFMNACSSEIFGEVLETPQKETTRPNPRSVYGISKNSAREIIEVYRKSYGLYAFSAISFNHEGELRQKHYLSRKVTSNTARIKRSFEKGEDFEPIELGNLDAKRDWSNASDFVEAMYLMATKINVPKDYVLSSNETHSIREFVEQSFQSLDIEGVWYNPTGQPLDEEFILARNGLATKKKIVLVKVNPKFYRPAEVELLLGDSSLARKELGWEPKTSFQELVRKMVLNDYEQIKNS